MADHRHHSARPASSVKPNAVVNDKPNYRPAEKAAAPNSNPSLGPVGLDEANARRPMETDMAPKAVIKHLTRECEDPDDGCEPDEDAAIKLS